MEGSSLEAWIGEQLSKLLGFDATEDISLYLLSMENKCDLEEYLQDLLNLSNTRHKRFMEELLKRWRPKMREIEPSVPQGVTVYKKDKELEHSSVKVTKDKNKKSGSSSIIVQRESSASPTQRNEPCEQEESPKSTTPRSTTPKSTTPSPKTKFVPLFGADGKDRGVIQIPGRHPCLCQSHKHGLVNNCLSCGRVVCKQEGSGPCVFCGNLVCTEEELEMIARGSRKGEKLQESLMRGNAVPKFPPQQEEDAQSRKAKEHKDKLINYDKTSARRTKVIDDESDYYATDNKWLTTQQREQLQKKKDNRHSILHASRKDKKITFDFAGRKLVDSSTQEMEDLLNDDNNSFGEDITNLQKYATAGITNPAYLLASQKPQFQQDDSLLTTTAENRLIKPPTSKRNNLRLQDKGLQEVVDNGMCLSMHQPWASLLVAGIKMHEGRTWYSTHRGRLWIASTAQQPSELEIETLKASYTQRFGSNIAFPERYPISCLLGCVDVSDVLPQDDYRQQFPEGESSSPCVFICENPQELALKFPMKGQHKIYKLDSQMHKAGRLGLQIASR